MQCTCKRRRWWSAWPRALSPALAVVVVVGGLGLGPGADDTASARRRAAPRLFQDFVSTASITIPDGGQAASSLVVSDFETEVSDVNVTITNLNHGQPGDLDLLLVGPGGQTALFLSDVGSSANNVTLTLDDQAASQVPSAGPITNGAFQPTNFQSGDTFSPPAPATPASGSELGVFNSTNPNGTWTLFVRDDSFGTTGSINGGWSLRIVSSNGVPNAAPDEFTVKAGQTLNELGGVLDNDRDPDTDPLTAILVGEPGKGEVQLQPDGSFTYKSKKKAKGTDSFTYLAQDPGGLNDLADVTIHIKKAKKKRKH